MSDAGGSPACPVPVAVARRVDQVCDRFEAAWKAVGSIDQRPRIEDFLVDVPEPERSILLRELLKLEIEERCLAGETLRQEEYESRFPTLEPSWLTDAMRASLNLGQLASIWEAPRTPADVLTPAATGWAMAASAEAEMPLAAGLTGIRCPHCHSPIQLSDDRPEEVHCSACGGSFRLRDERETTTAGAIHPLGKFLLLERVGLGAFGAVWRARDTELDRIVALKIPHASLLASEADLERFHREARAAAQLRHPGIVTVHEVQTLEGLPTIVSEYIDGVSLKDLLEVQRLTFREAASLLADVAEAVDYAHERGLVHRDLKPANIMIDRTRLKEPDTGARAQERELLGLGPPLVVDFGLALRSEAEITLTLDGIILGSPAYMSPEQAAGKGHHADRRSDVYSLGVILYELLCGELPFRGSKRMVLDQVRWEEPRPPRRLNDKIPRDLETICLKTMAKEPARRYGTAREMAADLRRFLNGEPIQARPVGNTERFWRWCRRNRGVAALIATVSFLLVLIAAVSTGAAFRIAAEQIRTETQRAQAQANLEQALKAVDEMLTQVGQTWLRDMPGVDEVRRDLLQKALGFYEEFLRQNRLDPALRLQTGQAHRRVGKIYELLGQQHEAEQAYREALTVFDELAHDFPDQPDYRFELAASCNALGLQQTMMSHPQQAEEMFQRAQTILSRLVTDFPNRADYRFELSRNYNSQGELWRQSRRRALARSAYEQSVAVTSHLVQDFPQQPDYQRALALSYNNLGLMQEKPRETQAAYDQAIAIQTELLRNFPKHPLYRQDLALSYLNQSALFMSQKMWAQAENAGLQAVALYTRLVADFPSRPALRGDLASGHNNLGIVYKKTRQWEKAQSAYAQALKLRAKLADDFPNQPQSVHALANSHHNLGLLLMERKQWEKAQGAFQEALRLQNTLEQKLPNRVEFRLEQVRSHRYLADLHQAAGHPDEAEAAARMAVKIMTELVNDFPKESDAQRSLEDFVRPLTPLLRHPEGLTEARQLLEKAITLQQAVVSVRPKDTASWALLRQHYGMLAEIFVRLRKHVDAMKAVAEMVGIFAERWEGPYDAVCCLAHCVGLVEQDEQLSASLRQEWVQTYSDRALVLLRQAIQNGFTDINLLTKAPELDRLRSHPGFQQLAAELEDRAKTGRP